MDVLQQLVKSYNDTEHRSTDMKLSAITKGDVGRQVWWHQYKPKEDYMKSHLRNKVPVIFKKGDHMRISHMRQTFEKGMDEKWTREIFQVRKPFMRFGIKKYRLIDLKGEELKGTFYEGELQKVTYSEDKTFEVRKILKQRGRGNKKEALVKWKGWPDKFNSWIPSKNIPE